MIPFWLMMAWRELRSAWRHFLYFLGGIALGVGAVVGVSLFSTNVERAVLKEARGLLGGDLEIRLSKPVGAAGSVVLQSLAERGILRTRVSELVAMVARIDRAVGAAAGWRRPVGRHARAQGGVFRKPEGARGGVR